VLGICLGAQLIASCLGARVYPNARKEIGWFPVEAVPAPAECFRLPAVSTVFHWHGETFDLPAGAHRIARSAACENQGFQLGARVIGLQFHLETTPASAAELIAHGREELVTAPYVQTEPEIVGAPPAAYAAINGMMHALLDYLARPPC
jgi:GMP synthase-like glutamine amidotransferase